MTADDTTPETGAFDAADTLSPAPKDHQNRDAIEAAEPVIAEAGALSFTEAGWIARALQAAHLLVDPADRDELEAWRSGRRRKSWPRIESVPDGLHYAAELARAQGTEGGDAHDALLRGAAARLKALHEIAPVLLAENERIQAANLALREKQFDPDGDYVSLAVEWQTKAEQLCSRAERAEAEVAEMRQKWLTFTSALGFGNNKTEPAAELSEMIDPIEQAFSDARDHQECAVICELCGDPLASKTCDECHGSGCLPNSALAYLECGTCAGVGKIHEGCVEKSYTDIVAEVAELEHRLACLLDELTGGRMSKTNYDVRTMVQEVEAYFERTVDDEVLELRATVDRVRLIHHHRDSGMGGFCEGDAANWPCPTIRALDGGAS